MFFPMKHLYLIRNALMSYVGLDRRENAFLLCFCPHEDKKCPHEDIFRPHEDKKCPHEVKYF